ncbi:PorP/SprF family type IX secretion system membrane protein [Ekhidna lutea]|uniref:PorP/SprF family type IX secretion system membrane protein n=1 Tax=Ekhidna lutea TaxID=447679 RepID=UPI0015C67D92|nr:type IX secretion system membrane protein PorP/SprF [Ekhidna lutea]
MKRVSQISLIGFFVTSLFTANAQQPQVYNQFFMNPYMYNPAYAGVEGHAAIFVMYRDQWTNVEGSPQISHASFHVPMQGGIAFGGAAFNISQGLLTTSAAKASASYLLNIDRTHFLRFGMSLGAGINSVNITEFDSPGDAAFDNFLDQSTFFIGDVGVAYHFGHFNVGVSLPNLFNYNPITQKEVADIEFSPTDNVLFKMNYRGHISDDFAFEPHIIYRYSNVIPHQYEAVMIAHLYHIVWVGASYRQDAGIIGLAGAKVAEKFAVGFAYELGNSNISSQLGPTLEVNLGYHLGTKKEHAEHVSSFIKSHRLSAEERARKAELERQRQLAALQQSRPDEEDDEDALSIAKPTVLDETETESDVPTKKADDWDHQEEHEKISRVNQFGEEETGIRLEKPNAEGEKNVVISWVPSEEADNLNVADDGHLERELPDGSKEVGVKYEKSNPDGSVEHIIKWDKAINETQAETISENPELTEEHHDEVAKGDPELTQDFRTHDELAESNDHVVTKRGDHLLELPEGNYVIAGAFSVFQNAEDYSDELFQMGFHDTIVGYNSARGYYYVVVYESGNMSQVRSKRDDIRKIPKLSKAWVLQVTE